MSIFDELDHGQARETVVNWENTLQSIEDGYRQYRGIPHGVQKDAIQNAWDARVNQKGTDWKFDFRFIEGKEHEYLVMQDQGTTGLTGRVLEPDEYLDRLPPEERWGRFESLAFTKDEEEGALGSRGRGKFIFVVASKQNVILYDTLTENESYRFGARKVERTESPIVHYDGREGRQKLKSVTHGRIPTLDSQGTRVIIVDPIEELVDAILTGRFLRFIGETWWEIMQKYDATIDVTVNADTETATLPNEFQLVTNDTEDRRHWLNEQTSIENEIRVNQLHLVHAPPEEIPDDIRGVAIQRAGMKVDMVDPKYLPEEISRGIYGYITVDRDAERELRRAENPEHYAFNYRFKGPRAIRNYIREEAERFAREKLSWNQDPRAIQRERQRSAERKALARMNRMTNQYDFDQPTPGPGPGGEGGTGEIDSTPSVAAGKEVFVEMPDIKLPSRGYRRVDYGQKVRGIQARVHNESDDPVKVLLEVYIRRETEKLGEYHKEKYELPRDSSTDFIGPYEQTFSPDLFPESGKHTIVSRISSLEGDSEGESLDEKRRSFFLEEEPPSEGGIFEDCEPAEFRGEDEKILGRAMRGEKGGYLLRYNTGHPEYETVVNEEDDQAEFLFRLMALELCKIDLGRGSPVLFEETDTEDPREVARGIGERLGEFAYDFYMEEGS